jgi:large subunit ribosomal protein L24
VKLKLGIDPSDQPLAIEAEACCGWTKFAALRRHADAVAPCRDCGVAVGAAVSRCRGAPVPRSRRLPRRRCSSSSNTYGPDDRAIRLTGTGGIALRQEPALRRRALGAPGRSRSRARAAGRGRRLPLAALKAFIEPIAALLSPAIPGAARHRRRCGDARDRHAAVRARRLQARRRRWDIETLEFRAPGFAQVRLGGRWRALRDGVSFKGPAQIEASNPRAFLAWLEGASETAPGQSGLLRAAASLTRRHAGIRGRAAQVRVRSQDDRGPLRLCGGERRKPPRLDAELKAPSSTSMASSISAVRRSTAPHSSGRAQGSLTVAIGRATVAGIDVKGVSGTFKLDLRGADVRPRAYRRSRRCGVSA